MENVWKDQMGDLTPEILAMKTDMAIVDMRDYLRLLMDERTAGKVEDEPYTRQFVTALIKTAGLELFRRSLDVGERGYSLMKDMMLQVSMEMLMEDMLDKESPIKMILSRMVEEHNCETCDKKDECPQEKQNEINTIRKQILKQRKI